MLGCTRWASQNSQTTNRWQRIWISLQCWCHKWLEKTKTGHLKHQAHNKWLPSKSKVTKGVPSRVLSSARRMVWRPQMYKWTVGSFQDGHMGQGQNIFQWHHQPKNTRGMQIYKVKKKTFFQYCYTGALSSRILAGDASRTTYAYQGIWLLGLCPKSREKCPPKHMGFQNKEVPRWVSQKVQCLILCNGG